MRTQIAVFVDAGYLYFAGTSLFSDLPIQREQISIDCEALIAEINQVIQQVSGGKPLLRIYWYENSTPNRALSLEYLRIGRQDNFKLRLVSIHQHSVRTATSSAITRDLVELSENHAISDALVISRYDALRPGIETTQANGVRVHILQISPEHKRLVTRLVAEVDTLSTWTDQNIKRFMSERSLPLYQDENFDQVHVDKAFEKNTLGVTQNSFVGTEPEIEVEVLDMIHTVVSEFIEELYEEELESCIEFWQTGRGVPNTYDKSLLFECRNTVGRNLTDGERQAMRNSFRSFVEERIQGKSKVYDTSAEKRVEA